MLWKMWESSKGSHFTVFDVVPDYYKIFRNHLNPLLADIPIPLCGSPCGHYKLGNMIPFVTIHGSGRDDVGIVPYK